MYLPWLQEEEHHIDQPTCSPVYIAPGLPSYTSVQASYTKMYGHVTFLLRPWNHGNNAKKLAREPAI